MLEGCQVISPQWRYLYVNDAAARQNHVKKEDLLGRTVMEVYPGIEETGVFSKLQRSMKERVSMENEFIFPDGHKAWFKSIMEPVPEGVFILSLDITRGKMAEEKNKLLIESMAENYIELDNKWHYKDVNKRIESTIGKKREELIDKHPYDVFPILRGSRFCKKLKEAKKENKQLKFEDKIPISGRWVELYVYPSEEGIIIYSHDITERKKAEESLRESEWRMNRSQEIAHIGSWELDLLTDQLFWSDEVYRIFGLMPQEFGATYEAFLEAVHPDDRKAVDGAYSGSIREEKDSYEIEHRVLRRSTGEVRIVHEKCEHFRDESGRVIKSVGMVHDITESKKAEEALKQAHDNLEKMVKIRTAELEETYSSLKESEEKFRGIFNNATDMISLIVGSGDRRSTRYIEVNEAGIKRLGYSREELLNMGPSDIDEETQTPEYIKKFLKNKHVQFETAHIAKDGRKIPVEVIIHCIEYKGRKVALEISRDISERKKAEERINQLVRKLRESEAHFKSLSENSPDLIIRVDRNLNYLYVNPTVMKITGKSPEYFIGKTIMEIGVPEEYKSLWKEEYLNAFETGKIRHMEFEFPTIIGLKFFERITVPEFNEGGEIETVLSISRDITERKSAEMKLEETIEELKRSNDELQRFAYVASHDLQEPLRTISSFTQLLERRYRGKIDRDADEFIEYVVEAAQRMQQMINDLLDYSRIMIKGKKFEEVNLEDLLKEVVNSLKTVIDENNAVITHDKLPAVTADEGQIRRVFQNLILNAIKFKKSDEPPQIHVSARKDKERGEYMFSVSDNGIGIEKQYFDRIFTIFQRLHTLDEYQGTGIGLSVVKRIIDRHGGHVWVESEPGVGSTFYFTIPINL